MASTGSIASMPKASIASGRRYSPNRIFGYSEKNFRSLRYRYGLIQGKGSGFGAEFLFSGRSASFLWGRRGGSTGARR